MRASDRIAVHTEPAWTTAPDGARGVFRPGGLALTDHALTLCNLPAGARVLDVGCGAAVVCAHLQNQHQLVAFGLDLSASLLETGRRRASGLPLIQARGERLPVAAESLDLVLAECSLSLMNDASRALAEFRRVLKPAGWLIVSDLYARAPVVPGAGWSKAAVQALVTACGFALERWEDYSAALKVFAAQWLFMHGRLPPLGCAQGDAPAAARPGYFLLSARRS